MGEQNELDRSGRGVIDDRMSEAAEPSGFLPPMPLAIERPQERQKRLAEIVAVEVVPQLMALHSEAAPLPGLDAAEASPEDILELARLVLGPDTAAASDFVLRLKDGGKSLDALHMELLEPTARQLGQLWADDRLDFVDVTLGVARLQMMVHVFEGLDQAAPYDEKRRILIAAVPGDQHTFGTHMVQKFLRAAGWFVFPYATPHIDELAGIVASEWLAVVGLSLSSDVHLDKLAETIRRVREASLNPRVGIMVGGPSIAAHPGWVERVGADGTAANAPSAVVLAKKLLVASLADTAP